MSKLAGLVGLARQVLERIVERECGACERNCCHQGTMMGVQDLRRLVRGLRVDDGLAERVRAGLRDRAEELGADAAAARKVLDLVRSAGQGQERDIAAAEARTKDLEELRDLLAEDGRLDYERLSRLLLHTAVRSNLIRAFRAFPGGEGALMRFAGPESSLKFRGRRVAPPKCLFLSPSLGCVAGRWKPAKCANFFCTADPSLLAAIRDRMDFDDFVLGNVQPAEMKAIEEMLKAEVELGSEYHEPMVVLGASREDARALADYLRGLGVDAKLEEPSGAPGIAEAETMAGHLPAGHALVAFVGELSAAQLYDLAIGLERVRLRDAQRMVVIAAEHLDIPSRPAHRLWADYTMAQPIGYLECYALGDAGAEGP
jgi:hypothetical protein